MWNANYEDLDWVTLAQDRFQWHPMLNFLGSLNLAIQTPVHELEACFGDEMRWVTFVSSGREVTETVAILRNE